MMVSEARPGSLAAKQKSLEANLSKNSARNIGWFQNAFVVYTICLMIGAGIYEMLGGRFSKISAMDRISYLSTFLEACGLLTVRLKIQREESVAGISGRTIVCYAWAYLLRVIMLPNFTWRAIDAWAGEVLEVFAFVLVMDIARCIFWTYRSTYTEDLEGMKVRQIVPACFVFAILLHADVHQGFIYNCTWTLCLYLDTTALMPQLFMMSKSGPEVAAPIANFVAATALSRAADIWYWTYAFKLVGPRGGGFNYSGWLIVFFHVLHSVLLCDFMYFWMKNKLALRRGLGEAMEMPTAGVYECV